MCEGAHITRGNIFHYNSGTVPTEKCKRCGWWCEFTLRELRQHARFCTEWGDSLDSDFEPVTTRFRSSAGECSNQGDINPSTSSDQLQPLSVE